MKMACCTHCVRTGRERLDRAHRPELLRTLALPARAHALPLPVEGWARHCLRGALPPGKRRRSLRGAPCIARKRGKRSVGGERERDE
ncbi:unnamed protein product [Urochloa humidicola]